MTKALPERKTVYAIRHVHFETLGTFEHQLETAGFVIDYIDVGEGGLSNFDPLEPDLLVILGGPIGVYEDEAYPFLKGELALIAARLASGLPMLGICLGAQLIAAALGARVAPTGVKEIGFAPVQLTEFGKTGPLRHLENVPVLHWHGDGFDLPDGADLLATSDVANQAFSYGPNILGMQFHPEADTSHLLETWLIGHAAELAGAGIDPRLIRAEAQQHGPALRMAAHALLGEWLSRLSSDQ